MPLHQANVYVSICILGILRDRFPAVGEGDFKITRVACL